MNVIMLVTNSYNPDPRVKKEATTLVSLGYNVEILSWDRSSSHLENEIDEQGIMIKRFKIKSVYGSGFKQIFAYVKFMNKTIKYLADKHFDVLHCHDLDSLIIGVKIVKKNRGVKLVYDQHDILPLYFKLREGILNHFIGYVLEKIENKNLRYLDLHIVVTDKMRDVYLKKTNPCVISNAPVGSQFKNISKHQVETLVIGFIGSVRYYNEIIELISVCKHYVNITVQISGDGIMLEKIANYIKKNEITNVTLTGRFKMDDLENLYRNIHITYLVYPDEPSTISMPNKFFESIITETPIIANNNSEYGRLIDKYKIGWTIDSKSLRQELETILNSLTEGKNSILDYKVNMRKIKDLFTWEENSKLLIRSYKELFYQK